MAVFLVFIIMIIIRGDFSLYPLLLLALFALLLILSALRLYQEWKEGGDWLEPGKGSQPEKTYEKPDNVNAKPAKESKEERPQ